MHRTTRTIKLRINPDTEAARIVKEGVLLELEAAEMPVDITDGINMMMKSLRDVLSKGERVILEGELYNHIDDRLIGAALRQRIDDERWEDEDPRF